MRDKTAKENGQTAAGIIHDLTQNEPAHSSTRNLQFSIFISLKKLYFTVNQHQSLDSFCSKTKLPNWSKSEWKLRKFTTVLVSIMGKCFSATKNIRIENHQSQPAWTSMTFWTTRGTNSEEHSLGWLIFLALGRADRLIMCYYYYPLSDRLILSSWFNIAFPWNITHISFLGKPKSKSRKRNFSIWKR